MTKGRDDETRVLRAASDIVTDPRRWYTEARDPRTGKTPKELVEEGRVEYVLAWIEAIASGVFF